jgi:hypothetical protein
MKPTKRPNHANIHRALIRVTTFLKKYRSRKDFFSEDGEPRMWFHTAWAERGGIVALFHVTGGKSTTNPQLVKLTTDALNALRIAYPDLVDLNIRCQIEN